MFTLLKSDDSKVMANSRFVKNAVFYKDMFTFFDAYEHIMKENKENLPNFCLLPNKEYCLEGICLFMKLYASEFGFETLKLTLDYLKVIYYTIAGYAEGDTVNKQLLVSEFEEYKKASISVVGEAEKEIESFAKKYEADKKKFDKMSNKYAKNLVTSNVLNVFYVIFLVFAFISAMIPFSLYFLNYLPITKTVIASGILLVFGLTVSLTLRFFSKKLQVDAGDSAYQIQLLKRTKDLSYSELRHSKDKSNRIISEKYEYLNSFTEALGEFQPRLKFKEILARANEYKLVSYNIKYDVERLFENQATDAAGQIAAINYLLNSPDSEKELSEIYQEIQKHDWLYYNNEVRFTFLRKFVEVSEHSHDWLLDVAGEKINPFGINIKALAKEEIAYLKSKEDLFVSSSIDKFLNTKYAKNLKEFELKGNYNSDVLKNIKVGYMDHFYDYEKLKDYNNLFYDKKIVDGIKISEEILSENKKVPTFVLLKIKLLENNIGLSNADSPAIKQIADEINGKVSVEDETDQTVIVDESDIVYPENECSEFEEIDEETVKFVLNGQQYLGYRPINT